MSRLLIDVWLYRPESRDVPRVLDAEGIGSVDAPRMNRTIEVDARVEGLAVDFAAANPVAIGVDAGDAAIGIQVPELGRLVEADSAPVIRGAGSELVVAATERLAQRDLRRGAGVVL